MAASSAAAGDLRAQIPPACSSVCTTSSRATLGSSARVTGQEFSKREAYPNTTDESFPRETHLVRRDADAYGIVLDAHGKIAWGRADIGGDAIVVLLTRAVSDAHLAGLREDGVSYIFAGEQEIDLALALELLNRELGIKRLLVEGGGGANGAFLRAGLIDEISLVVCPTVDGAKGAPSVFDSSEQEAGQPAPVHIMELTSSEVLDGGVGVAAVSAELQLIEAAD